MIDLIDDMRLAFKRQGFLGIVDCIIMLSVWMIGYMIGYILMLLDANYIAISEGENSDGWEDIGEESKLTDEELADMIARMNEDGPNN